MKKYSSIHPAIRHRFIKIRGPLVVLACPGEYIKNAIKQFDTLLETGPVCLINHGGQLFSIELPKDVDISKIPNSTYVKL